jgi:kynureninase
MSQRVRSAPRRGQACGRGSRRALECSRVAWRRGAARITEAERVYRPEAFHLPTGVLYMDGNSLGPLTRAGHAHLMRALDDWRRLGVAAWSDATPPWYTWPECLARAMAEPLLGAQPGEVAITGQTTLNLHQLLATFYRPAAGRSRLVVDALAFPTDRYAVDSALARLGRPPQDLAVVPSRDGRTLAHEDIVATIDERTAVVVLPSVLYRSGQLLDLAAVAAHARRQGAFLILDLSHSVGILPHALDAWGVDGAVWCNYKYLSAGPGAVGGLYLAARHHGAHPGLAGWWGSDKARQFAMAAEMAPAPDAGRFQVGTPSILSLAPLAGSLEVLADVSMAGVRHASLLLTEQLIARADECLSPFGVRVGTPRDPGARGGHVALEHPEARRVSVALRSLGVVPDFRPPDVVRLCPNPLYHRREDVDAAIEAMRRVLAERLYEGVVEAAEVT